MFPNIFLKVFIILITEDAELPSHTSKWSTRTRCCSTTLSIADRLETIYNTNSSPLDCPLPKKRKVNFSLTLDIKQETASDDACVPQGVGVSDVDSYHSDLPHLPTTPLAHVALRSRPSFPAQTSR